MKILDRVRPARPSAELTPQDAYYTEKDATATNVDPNTSSGSDSDTLSIEARAEKDVEENPNAVTANAQLGQQKIEAAALVWTHKALLGLYAWIWLCFFVLAFQSAIMNYAGANAYSSFANAPAISTAQILGQLIGGIIKLPMAKVLNLWGRAEGFLVMLFVYVLGLVIVASSDGPNSYAAGYVLYSIGYSCIYLILQIFIADTSALKHRALTWAFAATPFIITAFTGSLAGQAYLDNSTWQWAIGSFAIIVPAIFVPLAVVLKLYERKARKLGLFVRKPSGRSTVQSIVHYFWEFDIIGCFLIMAAFVLFLLPFSLQSYGRAPYDSATFIAMVVVGALLFPTFYIWERYVAPVHFIRWELLKNRSVLGACLLLAITFVEFYCWDSQFYYFLLVVYNLDVTYAGYMTSIYDVGSCFWGVIFGLYVLVFKHFKYFSLFFGLPLLTLGAGLMIYFRSQDGGQLGYIIMSQIFIAFGGGTLVIAVEMAVMAASDHDGVPMVLSLLNVFSNVGGAIGSAIAAAIYSNTFAKSLANALPNQDAALAQELYLDGYLKQLDYPLGSPERDAINFAWSETQKWECIASVVALVFAYPCIIAWKNYNVDRKQNKGTML